MTRSAVVQWCCLLIVSVAGNISKSLELAAADRPNIVWIMSEDNSKHYLKHFDRHGAPTPQIESLAQHGITFDRAFSCAPVCCRGSNAWTVTIMCSE